MSDSKKDFEVLHKIFLDFIVNLTNSEYDKLLRGDGVIRFAEKEISPTRKSELNNIIEKLLNLSNEQVKEFLRSAPELKTKAQLLEFCYLLNIDVKSKEKTETILDRIVGYIELNRDSLMHTLNKKSDIDAYIETVASELEKIMDIKVAKELILDSSIFSSKTNLMKLARKLDVHIDKDVNSSKAIELIVDSVVGSKIRSLSIRKKL